MKIFSLYMARRFFKPFLFGLGIFSLLIFLGDMFDKMSYLLRSRASLGVIMEYLWLEVPYWAVRVIPMATLLATLVALTGFVQSGEWIAAQASGFEPKAFWRPLLWCSLLVTVLSFAAQETVLPACYRRARLLWQDRIHPEWEWNRYPDISLLAGTDQFISAKNFFPKEGAMERPLFERLGRSGVASQLDALKAQWDPQKGHWVFYQGVERVFEGGTVIEKPFTSFDSGFTAPPHDLIPRTQSPEEMSLRELRRYARSISYLGVSPKELKVAEHGKIAYPFTNIVLCALGIPVALRLRRSAKLISFCTALGVSFVYLWLMEIGKALGNSGALPPLPAAWMANVLFGGLSAWLIRRYSA